MTKRTRPSLVAEIALSRRSRPEIESKNLGLLTAWRPELKPSESQDRNAQLLDEIYRSPFGFLHVRGRYVENYHSANPNRLEMQAYLLFGNADDSGNLKGFLRKAGRKYEQDAILHKGYFRDAELHALKDIPDLGLRENERASLGAFDPALVGHHFTLLTRRGDLSALARIEALRANPADFDWRGGHWEDVGFWTRKGFFARHERRVHFGAAMSEGGSNG